MGTHSNYYHNKGEIDAANNNYSPPHGLMDEMLTWSHAGTTCNIEENKAYDQGYFHTRGQIDQGGNDYSPPSDSECRAAYDAGWEAAKAS